MPSASLRRGVFLACALALAAQTNAPGPDRLWHFRNLGKAFYENPTTQKQAVDEFRKALVAAPNSIREHLNYGLALLRAGDMKNGIAELQKAQKRDARIPHTWFNLGIAFKKQGDMDAALAQLLQMARLVPNEPVTHYQLGSILKTQGKQAEAIKEFETARALNPQLAAPHFQLYGLYRQLDRAEDAAKELRLFQDLKKQQEGAAVPEDMEWSYYAEIYDPGDALPAAPLTTPVYKNERVADGFQGGAPGVTAIALDGGTHPTLLAWSSSRVALFRNGKTLAADTGLEQLHNVIFIAPGDFDNDGLPDLCIVTTQGAAIYRNVNGKFQKHLDIAGSFREAVWMDFDHDYDLDLLLVGDDSKLMRKIGRAHV